MANAYLETHGGLMLDVLNPKPEGISIEAIAHGLAHICRFGGHTIRHYSVAEHSVWVSQLVPPEFALQGLMHDATEAYLCDLPSPIKKLWPEYYVMEAKLHAVIAEKFGFSPEMPDEVKTADARICITEKIALIGADNLDGPEWIGLTSRYDPYETFECPINQRPVSHNAVVDTFLRRFEELTR